MNSLPSIFDLPQEDQAEFWDSLHQKLSSAMREDEQLAQEAVRLDACRIKVSERIQKYKVFLSYSSNDENVKSRFAQAADEFLPVNKLAPVPPVSVASGTPGYNKEALQPDKLMFIIRQPQVYGQVTFVGAQSIINALLQEEPELRKVSNSVLMKRIGPAVSRLAKDGGLIKRSERGHPSRIHYLSLDWFENGELKPEFQERLAHIDLLPVEPKPTGTKTANDDESLAGEESPSVTAEDDTNTETDEGVPSEDSGDENLIGLNDQVEPFQLR